MASSEELTKWLAGCALNDRRAFERLYQATAAQLFGLVLRIVKDRDSAGDVLQEAYLKIWRRAADFDAGKAGPLTWMGAIVRNQAIDWLRRSSRAPLTAQPVEELDWLADETAGPQEVIGQAQENRLLHDCLMQLEEAPRRALLLAYFEGLTHEELAQRLNTPLGTVKSWVRRSLLRLKTCLDEL